MSDLVVRLAVVADASLLHHALVQIATHLGAPEKLTSSVDDIVSYGFGSPPAFQAVVAEQAGSFAGACVFFPVFSTWMGKPGVYVQDLYVDPAYRRRGIGEALVRDVIERGRQKGASHLRLSVDAANAPAQQFYQRLGFDWSEDERIFMIRGERFVSFTG